MNRRALALALSLLVLAFACKHAPNIHPLAVEHNTYGTQYLEQGDLDKAEHRFQLALEYNPDYPEPYNNLCLVWIRRGKLDRAKDFCVKALRLNNDFAEARNNLGNIHLREGSFGKAHDDFVEALKINPGSVEARYNLCLTLLRLKKVGEARVCYDKIIEINGNLADPHHDLCILDVEASQFDSALKECGRAIELDPQYADAYYHLGLAYQGAGKHCEAQEAYKSCVAVDADNAECRNNLASAHRHCALTSADLNQAKEDATAENTPAGLYRLGVVELKKGLAPEAERHFRRCLKLDGRFGPCHCQLAELSEQLARRDELRDYCKKCLRYAADDEASEPQRLRCEKLVKFE